jgi:hypothetical protein
VRREDHAALLDERDRLNSAVKELQDDLSRARKATAAAEQQVSGEGTWMGGGGCRAEGA